jgi:hypothetical protein
VGGGGSCDDPNNMPYPLRFCHMLETAVTPSIIPLSVYNDDSVVALVSFTFPSNSTLVAIQARAYSFKEFVCFTCVFLLLVKCPCFATGDKDIEKCDFILLAPQAQLIIFYYLHYYPSS